MGYMSKITGGNREEGANKQNIISSGVFKNKINLVTGGYEYPRMRMEGLDY